MSYREGFDILRIVFLLAVLVGIGIMLENATKLP